MVTTSGRALRGSVEVFFSISPLYPSLSVCLCLLSYWQLALHSLETICWNVKTNSCQVHVSIVLYIQREIYFAFSVTV